jgi:hypothetical protein
MNLFLDSVRGYCISQTQPKMLGGLRSRSPEAKAQPVSAFGPGENVRARHADGSWRPATIVRLEAGANYLVQWQGIKERALKYAWEPPKRTALVHEDDIRRDGALSKR